MADNYVVTGQEQYDELVPGGRFVPSMRVQFKVVPSGATGEHSFPLDVYGPDVVHATLSARANDMNAVANL